MAGCVDEAHQQSKTMNIVLLKILCGQKNNANALKPRTDSQQTQSTH